MEMTKRAAEVLDGIICTEGDLRDTITKGWTSQQDAAKEFGVSGAFLHDMLHGKRSIGEKVPRAMGWKRVVVFVRGK